MEQPTLLDLPHAPKPKTARDLQREGIALSLKNADANWRRRAAEFIAFRPVSPFTSEDVTLAIGMPPGSPSVVGAYFNDLARKRLIHWTGDVVASTRPKCHAALLKVWELP